MNPFFEELRQLREQQNLDFELHTERLNAQAAAVRQVRTAVARLDSTVDLLQEDVTRLAEDVKQLGTDVKQLGVDVKRLGDTMADVGAASESSQESFEVYRLRTHKILDVLQAGALTGSIESESRFERLEQRVSELEKRLPPAA